MATLLFSHTSLSLYHHPCLLQSPSPFPRSSFKPIPVLRYSILSFSGDRNLIFLYPAALASVHSGGLAKEPPQTPSQTFLRLVASAAVFIGIGFLFGARTCSAASFQFPPFLADESSTVQEGQGNHDEEKFDCGEKLEAAFKSWKSKTYALSVPLKVVALRGSVPPAWVKDFMQSQGRRLKFKLKLYGSLDGIFSDLSTPFKKGIVGTSSVAAADIVNIGDSWLSYAIKKSIIEPIEEVEDQEWFKGLSAKWKVYLRRNNDGGIDPAGKVWAAPYRWGCMVIAYKKSKFQQHHFAPIEDWADLWRPELAGRISMVDSPREVVGAVLKYVGASYNTNNILQVDGVQQNLALLRNQVRLFDSMNYLKAFGAGDTWVAVGWSSDVLPVAKRMSNIAVVVPKSGASLWADLWAIPAASGLETNKIGGRIRGPSPMIHQWIEFCLQAARAVPFMQEVIPGASPSALESTKVQLPDELAKGKPRLDTNLVAGLPPPDILARCEFLEPLSDSTLSEYQWLISSIQKSNHLHGLIHKVKAG